MVTYCWTVMRQVAPHIHRHAAHPVHRSGRILHRLPKFAHHPAISPMLVCRALPLALGLLHSAPIEPPGHSVAPPAFVQPVQQGQFISPNQPSGPPPFPNPFAWSGQSTVPNDPGTSVSLTPLVNDPWPNGDPPIIVVTTSADPTDPAPPSTSSVDEPPSGIVILGAIASLLWFRQARRIRRLTRPTTGRRIRFAGPRFSRETLRCGDWPCAPATR